MEIKECVAMVTGGVSGLGEAAVRMLAARGAKVSVLDINDDRGKKIMGELGREVIFCRADVTDEISVQAGIDKTMEAFGAIHITINCAGVSNPEKVMSKRGLMRIENFNRAVQLNLVGTMNVIRLSAEKIMRNAPNEDGERGVIINTASIAAFDGQIGQAAYSASKAGVVGMTLPLAREFAEHGIRVVTIAPGLFRTPMAESLPPRAMEALESTLLFPRRLGKPSEYAQVVGQIIENPMFNGTTIRLDGALRMAPK